jgi:hypothetical protein
MTGRVFMYEGSPVDFAAVILGMLSSNKSIWNTYHPYISFYMIIF